jgi:aldehyde dehydrogenase (NAD+)
MIFILAFSHTGLHLYRNNISICLQILSQMQQFGFCKIVSEETPIRLADLGILPERNSNNAGILLDEDLIAQLWGNFDS